MPSFGVCYIEDLLIEVSDSQVVLSGGTGDQAFISIPKKGMENGVVAGINFKS